MFSFGTRVIIVKIFSFCSLSFAPSRRRCTAVEFAAESTRGRELLFDASDKNKGPDAKPYFGESTFPPRDKPFLNYRENDRFG